MRSDPGDSAPGPVRRQSNARLAGGRRTTDQQLLDSRAARDWMHTDPWRVLRIVSEFVEGFESLAELGPAVSVFGSARSKPGSEEAVLAEKLGGALAEAGYA
ncbi:MAG: TIGR00730 family Rossman fold protein, partial [Micromonosporaceae bacterium]